MNHELIEEKFLELVKINLLIKKAKVITKACLKTRLVNVDTNMFQQLFINDLMYQREALIDRLRLNHIGFIDEFNYPS